MSGADSRGDARTDERPPLLKESVVAAGAVVVEDVPPNTQVVGVPARIVNPIVLARPADA